jgi:oligoribonuclease (3'-5' exoribonuclease)
MSTVYCAYDLETGDLEPEDGDLLTGCFLMLDEDFKILDELNLRLKPDGRLPVANSRALEVNKIDLNKHVMDPNTITYAEGKDKLVSMLKKYLKKRGKYSNLILMGYNIRGFDNRWLQHHLVDKTTLNSLVHYKYLDVADEIDVLKRHGWLPPTLGTLGSAVEFFGIPKGEAHVAKDDILMTVGVFRKVKELLESKKNGGSSSDLISLLEAE